MPSRRRFVALSVAALAGLTRPVRLFAQQRLGIPVFSEAALGAYTQGLMTKAHFEEHIGSSFRIFLDDGKVADMELRGVFAPEDMIAAARSRTAEAAARTARMRKLRPSAEKCFVVEFSSGGVDVPQGSFVLDHGRLGSFTVFLVPSGVKGNATALTTFNYLT